MRIAEIHWAFPPTIGGVETHLAILGPGLVARGHTVALLCGQPPGIAPVASAGGMTIERTPLLDLNQMSEERFADMADEVHEQIENFLLRFRPDVIHVHNLHYFSPVPLEAVIAYRHRHGVPVVLTAHNTWHDACFAECTAAFAADFDAVIAVSGFIRDDLIRLGYPPATCTVVPHGLPREWWTAPRDPWVPFPEAQGRPVIFHPARLSRAKGSPVVVEAFARLRTRHPTAFLWLAGTAHTVDWGSAQAAEIAAVQAQIAAHGLAPHVGIAPFPWAAMRRLYDAATIVVYPSLFPEPFGIVVIEAMARARPVVVTQVGGMPEIVDRQSGCLVPPGDPAALAEALDALLRDPARARRLGTAARRRVARHFTAEAMIARTEAVLHDAIRGKNHEHGASLAS
jgi:glycogen(starch) synthase